jgi:hypothetical protein
LVSPVARTRHRQEVEGPCKEGTSENILQAHSTSSLLLPTCKKAQATFPGMFLIDIFSSSLGQRPQRACTVPSAFPPNGADWTVDRT